MTAPDTTSLPENAYTPLAPGQVYQPVIPAAQDVPQATWRAVLWGLLFCVVFSVASAYSGLKVGQVMEAAIPISILAIGLARVYGRRSTLLENVIMTGIGGRVGLRSWRARSSPCRRCGSSSSTRTRSRRSSSASPAACLGRCS